MRPLILASVCANARERRNPKAVEALFTEDVDQNVKQRMLGIGRLSIETAGGSSAIGINNVDSPQNLADMILERSRQNPHHL